MVDEKSLKREFEKTVEREFSQDSQASEKERGYMALESQHYLDFKAEILPQHLSLYEKACTMCERFLSISLKPDQQRLMQQAIDTCHLSITPSGVVSFAVIGPILIALIGGVFGFLIPYIITGKVVLFFPIFFLLLSVVLMLLLYRLPYDFARQWRMKGSNQMVLCMFYVVTYMRHTSNIENAIDFASSHLTGPLALDLRKVLWDVETQKYQTVRESLDLYLEQWKDFAMEFVEAFHLVESSLLEPLEARRLELLDKSLDVILDETYEKMLHYAHNLHSPMTMLHMLGVIMPVLGLVILPLVVSIMGGVKWYYVATLYNILLPLMVLYLGKQILATRPTGFGDTSITEDNPETRKYRVASFSFLGKKIEFNPMMAGVAIFLVLMFIGLLPLQLSKIIPGADGGTGDYCVTQIFQVYNPVTYTVDTPPPALFCVLEYREVKETGEIIGPFGLIATMMSIAIVMALGLAVGVYYKLRSSNVIKLREDAKSLENEFATGLFQLGNRIGDGLPAEVAFGRVSQTLAGTQSGEFFSAVSANITQRGMSLEQAIFDPKSGAVLRYPSAIIGSSMKMMVESVRKGPDVAARSLTNISRYIKEIHRVNERLRDLMADIISDLKSQIKFLTPAIAAIVVGITSMITLILGKLDVAQSRGSLAGAEGIGNILGGEGIPTYYFQIIVGVYIVELIYILTVLGNQVENGADKFNEEYELGTNLTKSTLIYSMIVSVSILGFSLLAAVIINRSLV